MTVIPLSKEPLPLFKTVKEPLPLFKTVHGSYRSRLSDQQTRRSEPTSSPFVEMGLFVLAEEDELGVARRAMRDAEAGEIRAGGRRLAAFVATIPLHLVYAGVERRVHERAHELALDVVDGHVDGCSTVEVEAEVGRCVKGVRPHLERGCRCYRRCFGRGFGWGFCGASG